MTGLELFHYTCDHCAQGISAAGFVRPHRHPLLGEPLAWFTDLDTPIADALGLGPLLSDCDRTRHRFQVLAVESCIPWHRLAREFPRRLRNVLEQPPGMPGHWWVSREPVAVTQPVTRPTTTR